MARQGLWRHSDFKRLWLGQSLSVFGSLVGRTAMSFTAILVLHATPFQLGLLAAAGLVPGLLASLFVGAWVDRVRRRPIMIGADVGRALALGSVPLAALLGRLSIQQLYIVAFLISVLSICFDVAYQSYLPALIEPDQLMEGNSKLAASSAIAEVAGFGIAGWLVQLLTAPITILIDAISFVCSAVSVALIRQPEPPPAPGEQQNMLREITAGLREVRGNPLLRAPVLCTLTLALSGSIYGTLVVLYMSEGLGFAPGILTMIWAVGGVSSLLGALLAPRATTRLGIGPIMIMGLVVGGLSMLLIPLARGATLVAALLLLAQQLFGDIGFTLYQINELSLRQAVAPEQLRGRVNASVHCAELAAMLAGSLLGGLLGETLGVRGTLVVGGCGTLLALLWLVFSPLRRLRAVEP